MVIKVSAAVCGPLRLDRTIVRLSERNSEGGVGGSDWRKFLCFLECD